MLRYRLTPPEMEAAFREEGLARDKRVAITLMLVATAFHLVSIPGDLQLFEDPAALRSVLTIRLVSAALALACIPLALRVRRPTGLDHLVFGWGALLLVGLVLANAQLPPDYTSHVGWDVFLAITAYAVAPLPLGRQLLLASIITVGDLWIFWQIKELDHPFALADVTTAFLAANVVGVFASWELQGSRRRAFLSLQKETHAREDVERAWKELKTLRGIIPICASCKNIRAEDGDWQQLEAYVHTHSEAEFSHGLCPSCAVKLYGEEGTDPFAAGR